MDSLPPVLLDFISVFRPLMRAEVFDSFTYLLCGLLIGWPVEDLGIHVVSQDCSARLTVDCLKLRE